MFGQPSISVQSQHYKIKLTSCFTAQNAKRSSTQHVPVKGTWLNARNIPKCMWYRRKSAWRVSQRDKQSRGTKGQSAARNRYGCFAISYEPHHHFLTMLGFCFTYRTLQILSTRKLETLEIAPTLSSMMVSGLQLSMWSTQYKRNHHKQPSRPHVMVIHINVKPVLRWTNKPSARRPGIVHLFLWLTSNYWTSNI